jgi:hypothetical protein
VGVRFRGQGRGTGRRSRLLEATEEVLDAARDAIRVSQDDPSPWVTLVMLAEARGRDLLPGERVGPPGRTTALLPAVAHLARFLRRVGTDPKTADAYVQSEATRSSLRASADRWLADPSPVCAGSLGGMP